MTHSSTLFIYNPLYNVICNLFRLFACGYQLIAISLLQIFRNLGTVRRHFAVEMCQKISVFIN